MRSSHVPPSAAWQAAFRAQADHSTTAAALRCATLELDRLRRLGIEPLWDAEDMVQHVLVATYAGDLTWDPDAVPLRVHLRDAMRDMARRARDPDRVHGAVVELDALSDDSPALDDRGLEVPAFVEAFMVNDLASRFAAELRTLVGGDTTAQQVMTAVMQGHTGLEEIAAATGLPQATARNAWIRLRRLATELTSASLVSEIREHLAHLDVAAAA